MISDVTRRGLSFWTLEKIAAELWMMGSRCTDPILSFMTGEWLTVRRSGCKILATELFLSIVWL